MKAFIPKNKYVLLFIFFILSIATYIIIEYFKEQDIETFKTQSYNENIVSANIYLSTLIKEKENATTTIGLGLSKNDYVINALKKKESTGTFLKDYSKRLAENTDFKNVWFQLVSSDGTSIDRSWTDIKSDNLVKIRSDLERTLKDKVIVNSISVGRFDLTFKSIIPIYDNDNKVFLGAVEVITHFNSISQRLEDKKIFAVVLADKIYKKQLIYPSSKTFIGDYYVANANVKKNLLAYFRTIDMDSYLAYFKSNDYFIDPGLQSVVSYYPLNDAVNNKKLGHILLIQDMKNIDANSINYINYIYNIYFLFAIIALMLVIYLSATIEIKNLTGKAYAFDILLYISIVYIALALGIYNLLSIKYDGDIESYNKNMTAQTLLEYNSIVEKNRDIADFIYDGVVNTPTTISLFQQRDRENLYNTLLNQYKKINLKYNVRQLHFHLSLIHI